MNQLPLSEKNLLLEVERVALDTMMTSLSEVGSAGNEGLTVVSCPDDGRNTLETKRNG
jgi:hypothetical protein